MSSPREPKTEDMTAMASMVGAGGAVDVASAGVASSDIGVGWGGSGVEKTTIAVSVVDRGGVEVGAVAVALEVAVTGNGAIGGGVDDFCGAGGVAVVSSARESRTVDMTAMASMVGAGGAADVASAGVATLDAGVALGGFGWLGGGEDDYC